MEDQQARKINLYAGIMFAHEARMLNRVRRKLDFSPAEAVISLRWSKWI